MNKEEAIIIIENEIFKREIEFAEKIFADESMLKHRLQFHNEAMNRSLKSIFDSASNVLQNVIDANYKRYFEVPQFLTMNLENYNETFNHNLQILSASRRLLKFCEI